MRKQLAQQLASISVKQWVERRTQYVWLILVYLLNKYLYTKRITPYSSYITSFMFYPNSIATLRTFYIQCHAIVCLSVCDLEFEQTRACS